MHSLEVELKQWEALGCSDTPQAAERPAVLVMFQAEWRAVTASKHKVQQVRSFMSETTGSLVLSSFAQQPGSQHSLSGSGTPFSFSPEWWYNDWTIWKGNLWSLLRSRDGPPSHSVFARRKRGLTVPSWFCFYSLTSWCIMHEELWEWGQSPPFVSNCKFQG